MATQGRHGHIGRFAKAPRVLECTWTPVGRALVRTPSRDTRLPKRQGDRFTAAKMAMFTVRVFTASSASSARVHSLFSVFRAFAFSGFFATSLWFLSPRASRAPARGACTAVTMRAWLAYSS